MGSCDNLQELNKNCVPDSYNDQTPQLCVNGCGFFGTKAYKNLCSKCFKQHILQNQKERKDEKPNKNPFPSFNNSMKKVDSLTRNEDAAADEKNNNKVLCTCCKKRIRGLMIYKCRCNGRFCVKHRCPEEHSCNFDFKNLGRLDLAKHNPVVKGEKLYRI